jgi:hypothetical protein
MHAYFSGVQFFCVTYLEDMLLRVEDVGPPQQNDVVAQPYQQALHL